MEKNVVERRRANALNQDNPQEVAVELQEMEEKIDAEKTVLLKQVRDFQEYLEKQTAEEKNEVTQLNAEQTRVSNSC